MNYSPQVSAIAGGLTTVEEEVDGAVDERQLVDDRVARQVQVTVPAIGRELLHKETSDNNSDKRDHTDDVDAGD